MMSDAGLAGISSGIVKDRKARMQEESEMKRISNEIEEAC